MAPSAGVFVLGMHRSGTSVVAGLLDGLGLDGGPRASMLSADQFNSDGYWEQRPVVEWHDRVLGRLAGWASAPPPEDPEAVRALHREFAPSAMELLGSLYEGPWFMKDPRQCLLLAMWDEIRGQQDVAIAVFRDPDDVVRSLRRRNGYPAELAVALWERYCRDMLVGLAGRPCVLVRYDDLLQEPDHWIATIATFLERRLPGVHPDDAAISQARALVRAPAEPSDRRLELTDSQRALLEALSALTGSHEQVVAPQLPPPSPAGQRLVERRRRRLNAIRPLISPFSSWRAKVDRLPSLLRRDRGVNPRSE